MKIYGHYWVERDGKIIDPWFKQYKYITRVQGTTQEQAYEEADKELMLTVTIKALKYYSEVKVPLLQSIYGDISKLMMFGECFLNAISEVRERGGTLKFGKMGFKRADGSVWWEYEQNEKGEWCE
jgi:hypothetical protein